MQVRLQDISVQILLSIKVEVDGGDVHATALADIPNAGVAKALNNQHFVGRF